MMQRRRGSSLEMDIFRPCVIFFLWTFFSVGFAKLPPFSVPISANWYGYDGTWSAISIRVGSPPQWIDVLPCTASVETWVIGTGGCGGNDTTALALCRSKRGGLFDTTKSSTWQGQGFFELGLEPWLGYSGVGFYGYDNVDFEDKVISPGQIVGVINSTDWLVGMLGLGDQPTNVTTENTPSLLVYLRTVKKLIPSLSYGYTAGAYYRGKSVPASLTLGGYDKNRFVPHNITFDLDPNHRPVTSVNGITVTSSPSSGSGPSWGSAYQLMSSADSALMNIDSSTPYLWLPEAVCQKFEKALGLTYDETLQLYKYVNGTNSPNILSDWNLTFTFSLANLPTSSQVVNITLPYDAFNLQLTFPFPGLNATASSQGVPYFPLRKAANSTQYVLGRSFLQESYLKLDFERRNFSVYQAVFDPNKVAIASLISISSNSTSSDTGSGHALGVGAIVGIAVSGAAVLLGALLLVLWCRRKPPPHDEDSENDKGEKNLRTTWLQRIIGRRKPVTTVNEAPGDVMQPAEVPGETVRPELDATSPVRLVELPGSEGNAYTAHARDGKGDAGANLSAYQETSAKLHQRSELHGESLETPTSPGEGEGFPMPAPLKSRTGNGPFEHYAPLPGVGSPPISPALSHDRHFTGGYPGPPPQYLPPPHGHSGQGIPMGPPSPGVVSSVGSSDTAIGRNGSRNSRFREAEMGGFESGTLSPGGTRYGSAPISPGSSRYGSETISPATNSAGGTMRSPDTRRYSWESDEATR